MIKPSIQELIDEAIKEENSQERTPSGKYRPSLFGRCFRLQYWKRKNITPTNPPDERTMRVFKVGNVFHNYIQGIIIKQNKEAKKEVLLETEDIKGFADLVLNDEVIDIKTQHSKSFHYMRKLEGNKLLEEKLPNVLQVSWYALNLSKDRARLVFVSKDDLCIQEVGFKIEDWIKTKLSEELFELRSFWEKEKLPPPVPRAYNGKDCEYCEFLDLCKKQERK